MTRILSLCFILLAAVSTRLQAQIHFSTADDWETVLETARQEQKNIFIDVYTSWCGPCKRMAREVFSDPAVGKYMNDRFVCIQLDAEKQAGHPFFRLFKPNAYPTYYWLDADGLLLDSRSGYMPGETFLQAVHEAVENQKGKRLKEFTARWKGGERDTAFVEEYLFEVLPQFHPDSVRPFLNQYLAGLTPEQLRSPSTGRMVMRFTRNLEDDLILRTLLGQSSSYREQLTREEVDKAIYLVLVRIPMMHFNTDKNLYAADLQLLNRLDYPDKELYNKIREIEQKLFSAQYGEGLQQTVELCQAHEQDHPSFYSELYYTLIISKFFQPDYNPGTEELSATLHLAKKAFHLSPSQNTLSYLAAAYARAGNYRKAYQALAYLPFYKAPTLSNAVYPLLGIVFDREKGE